MSRATSDPVVFVPGTSPDGDRLLHLLGRYPLELGLCWPPLIAGLALWRAGQPPRTAITVPVLACVLLLAVPRARRTVHGWLVRARWQRRLNDAVDAIHIGSFHGRRPTLRRVTKARLGTRLSVLLPAGGSTRDLAANADRFACALGVRAVRVATDRQSASCADLILVRRDPLAEPAGPWPALQHERLQLWDPVPVGIDEDGEPVSLLLPEHNLLLGGEPGAGKSAALSLLIAAAALDPTVTLWCFDGKQVELITWQPLAERFVGPDLDRAVRVLRELHRILEDRFARLLALGVRKVTAGDGNGLHLVVIDELAMYLTGADRTLRAEFTDLLRDLVSRGRAAGIIVLAATQKPGSDIIPTSLRDLFGYRWALRCTTAAASDTILGSGWASGGITASSVDPAQRGVGYLLAEGGTPVRLRAHYLSDELLRLLADRGYQHRAALAADRAWHQQAVGR